MKKRIEILQKYFRNKVVRGNYELISINSYSAKIKIEDYLFSIWYTNGIDCFEHYTNNGNYLIDMGEFSDEEKELGYAVLMGKIEVLKLEKLNAEKISEYNQLKRELKESNLI